MNPEARKIMKSPNAPLSAVLEIVKTFRGDKSTGPRGEMLVKFDNSSDTQNVTSLVEMLNGWSVEAHPNQKNAVRIFAE